MDPEFAPLMTVVIVVGIVGLGIGTVLLYMTFRAFASAKRGDVQHIVLLISTLTFIIFLCFALMVGSMVFKR